MLSIIGWIVLGHVLCFLELLALGRLVRWAQKPGAAVGGENSKVRGGETVGVIKNDKVIQDARTKTKRGLLW